MFLLGMIIQGDNLLHQENEVVCYLELLLLIEIKGIANQNGWQCPFHWQHRKLCVNRKSAGQEIS